MGKIEKVRPGDKVGFRITFESIEFFREYTDAENRPFWMAEDTLDKNSTSGRVILALWEEVNRKVEPPNPFEDGFTSI